MMKHKCKFLLGGMHLAGEINLTEDQYDVPELGNLHEVISNLRNTSITIHGPLNSTGWGELQSEPIIPVKQATLSYLCSQCHQSSSFTRTITLGNNITDIVCPCCGEIWHVNFQVLQLEPLVVGDWLSKRMVGLVKDGMFFDKSVLQ